MDAASPRISSSAGVLSAGIWARLQSKSISMNKMCTCIVLDGPFWGLQGACGSSPQLRKAAPVPATWRHPSRRRTSFPAPVSKWHSCGSLGAHSGLLGRSRLLLLTPESSGLHHHLRGENEREAGSEDFAHRQHIGRMKRSKSHDYHSTPPDG